MQSRVHGGECCGLSHVFDFNTYDSRPVEAKKAEIERAIKHAMLGAQRRWGWSWYSPTTRHNKGHAFEVVLISAQLSSWREALEDTGFKEVFSFVNGGSGNRCYVFMYAINQ